MPVFVDVSAVRIQRYLARWPNLVGRRGASALLAELTDPDNLPPAIAALAEANPDAADADGKLSLRLVPGADPELVARRLLEHLSSAAPAAEFQATWAEGPDYATAYHHLHHEDRPERHLVTVPPVSTCPLARPCDACQTDPAVTTIDAGPGRRRVCLDCRARAEAGARRAGRTPRTPLVEERLRSTCGEPELAPDFQTLAAQAPADTKANHLATVFIDGNRIGETFDTLPADRRAGASRALAESTFEALATATNAVQKAAGARRLPVVPHVLGGDDVLVSVPAPWSWLFVRSFLAHFETRTRDGIGAGAPVTAGAGVFIAHHRHPFPRCVDATERLLRTAKRATAGRASAVAWVDHTADGEEPPPGRRPWTLEDLERRSGLLDELAATPAAGRAALLRALDADDDRLAGARARRQAERVALPVATRLLDDGGPQVLRDAIDLVRWWR